MSPTTPRGKTANASIKMIPNVMYESPGGAFAALKIYDANKSPVRVPKEDWEGAKNLVASDPAWAKWLAGQQKTTDDWMEKRAANK